MAYYLFKGKHSILRLVFKERSSFPSLASVLFAPNARLGLRSIFILLTQGYATGDSLLRMLLVGEEDLDLSTRQDSLLRLLCTPSFMGKPSLLQLLLQHEPHSLLRKMISSEPNSLMRSFVSPTHQGRAPIVTFFFKGEPVRPSLLRLLSGREPEQMSILRLLLKKNLNHAPPLFSLLMANTPSLLDIVLQGENEEAEMCLIRLVLGSTVALKKGRIVWGGVFDADSKDSYSLAHAALAGEEYGGPGISLLRLMLIGEESENTSLLRLLLMGEESSSASPLRVLFTGAQTAFVAHHLDKDLKNWRENIFQLMSTITNAHSQGGSWAGSFRDMFTTITTKSQEGFKYVWEVLQAISSRGRWLCTDSVSDKVRYVYIVGEKVREVYIDWFYCVHMGFDQYYTLTSL